MHSLASRLGLRYRLLRAEQSADRLHQAALGVPDQRLRAAVPFSGEPDVGARTVTARYSYRVAGGFGGVGASGWGGPAEGAIGELVNVPSGVLLEPVVVAAFGAGVA